LKYKVPTQEESKKRSLEGTNLSNQNSFAILDNAEICSTVEGMGVSVTSEHFESVNIMKDLELARHALDKVKKKVIPDPNIEMEKEENEIGRMFPLLEGMEEDSKTESFILVESKKKRKQRKKMENMEFPQIRRSKRCTPSVYIVIAGQENPGPGVSLVKKSRFKK
jgi:hypothetical protein